MRKLDARELVFVGEYLVDLDPKRAALAAKYSATVAASKAYQWVSNSKVKPHVFAAIRAGQVARSKRTEITQDMVLRELAKIGFADIRKAVKWGEGISVADAESGELTISNGISLVGSEQIDDDTAAAISEVSQTMQGLKIKMHDKKGALVDIGRHLGMFPNKTELTGKDGGPLQVEAPTLNVILHK